MTILYVDKFIYESVEFDLQQLKLFSPVSNCTKACSFSDKKVTMAITATSKSESLWQFQIKREIINFKPGAYVWKVVILDVFGQLYFDMNFLFLAKSSIGATFDRQTINDFVNNEYRKNEKRFTDYQNPINFTYEAHRALQMLKILPPDSLE